MDFSIRLIFLPILLFLSGAFSASETALFSLSKLRIKRLQARQPSVARIVLELLNSPRKTLTSILIGNMLVNVCASAIATSIAVELMGDVGVGIAVGIMTFLLLVFGEVTPKTFAIRNAEALAIRIAKPLYWFAQILFPVRWFLKKITDFFYNRLVGKKAAREPLITQAELETLVSIGEKEGIFGREERHMIHTVFEFGKRTVDEILIPRVDMVAASVDATAQQLVRIMEEFKHNKIPIYKDTIDNILGMVYTKDFMLQPKQDWPSFIKPVLFIPETKMIDELLVEFQSKKIYLAIVIDEYGGTSGLVTMEDILEEIVGEIRDEYDKEEKAFERIDANTFRVSGRMTLHDLNEELGLNIRTEEAETIGGYILFLFGRIPKADESIRRGNLVFFVDQVKDRRIEKIVIKKISPSP